MNDLHIFAAALRTLIGPIIADVVRLEVAALEARLLAALSSSLRAAQAPPVGYMRVAAAAVFAGVKAPKIREWIATGHLRRYGDGRPWLVSRAELERFIESTSSPVGNTPTAEQRAAAMLARAASPRRSAHATPRPRSMIQDADSGAGSGNGASR